MVIAAFLLGFLIPAAFFFAALTAVKFLMDDQP